MSCSEKKTNKLSSARLLCFDIRAFFLFFFFRADGKSAKKGEEEMHI